MSKLYFFMVVPLLLFVRAQTAQDLIGTWEAQVQNIRIIQTIRQDGSYSFEVPAQTYLEKGTWQLDGVSFSQQWSDPNTGEAQQATYTIEFLSKDSFRQSGGNLEGAVYTFTRVQPQTTNATNPLSNPTPATAATSFTLADKSTLLKLPPPEAGEYECSHTSLTVGSTFDPVGSLGTTMPVYGVTTIESLVGNLLLDGNGNYTMTKSGGGTYTFDSTTNGLSFTGELAQFPIDYFVSDGKFTVRLNFLDENNKEETSLDCTLFSDTAVTPTTPTPNPGLPGTLGLHSSNSQIITFVAETGEVQILGEGMEPYQAANGETIFVSNNGLLGTLSEFTILASDGTLAARLEIDDSEEITDSTDVGDIFGIGRRGLTQSSVPILSDDGTLIAYSSVDDVGTQNVMVRRRNAGGSELIAVIPDMAQPSWTPDGRLLMAGGARARGLSGVEGLYRTDSSFSKVQSIGTGLVSPAAPALSPDGKTIAFLQDSALWLMNSDGSNPRPLVNQMNLNVYGFPAWSPDGHWLAVAASEPDFESWTWLLVLPVDGNTKEAQRLELPSLDPISVSRDSRITWR